MKKEASSGLVLTLLLIGLFSLAFNIQPVRAYETIYIRPDGSIDPTTAPIQRDGGVYTLTDNITGSIVVERSNIIVDGDSNTLTTEMGDAFTFSYINSVTIRNTRVDSYYGYCIRFSHSSYNTIFGNDLQVCQIAYEGEGGGIYLSDSPHNTIYQNNIEPHGVQCCFSAIILGSSSFNNVSENTIRMYNSGGISLSSSGFNNIFRNNIDGIGECITGGSSSFNNISENYLFGGMGLSINVGGSNNTIFRNTCTGSFGVDIYGSNNTIRRNDIINMQGGLGVTGNNNIICENNIEYNTYSGLGVGGTNNIIYHNNFIAVTEFYQASGPEHACMHSSISDSSNSNFYITT